MEIDSTVTALICGQDGEVFIGTLRIGIHLLSSNGENVTPVGLLGKNWQPTVYALHITSDGYLLAATGAGIYKTVQKFTSVVVELKRAHP